MSVNKDINILRDKILLQRMEYSDTLSDMLEKSNNSFEAIVEWGGGPKGPQGPQGPQGVPTKPKNPIHIWIKGEQYSDEISSGSIYEILGVQEGLLSGSEYKEGHCIFLENGHVYVLELIGFDLVPVYRISMQSYNPGDVVNGKNAYVHFAYANSSDGSADFITGDDIRENTPTTYNLRRMVKSGGGEDGERTYSYMGVCSDYTKSDPDTPFSYIWTKIEGRMGLQGLQGNPGPAGPAGPKGDKGDGFTGHPYVIDLEGDMSTINIDIDRTRLYDESNDYCECVLHAYYGNDSWILPKDDVTLDTPKDDNGKDIGTFTLYQSGNDVKIKFVPDEKYVFPTKNLQIPITVKTKVDDPDNNEVYDFERKTIWIIKPIMATFELEIRPSYRVVKIYDDGERYPKNLEVFVYKIEDTNRSIFDLSAESEFTLLWKYQDDSTWNKYTSPISTENASCIELQIVRSWDSTVSEDKWDIWDYEDVWTVADGKGTHYYHADLGSTESMMVLTTGEKISISDDSDAENYIAELRDPNGYSIIFEPHFYDGTTPLRVIDVDLYTSDNDMENLYNGRFDYTFENITTDDGSSEGGDIKYKFTVTQVPYGMSVIPLSFAVIGEYVAETKLDPNGDPIVEETPTVEQKTDIVSFNVYISTMAHIYTLQPSVSAFNTSKGVAYNGEDIEVVSDTIGCSVFRDGQEISADDNDLALYNLTLKWFVHQEDGNISSNIYTEPLVFGEDDDVVKDHFQSNDIMVEFILYYDGVKEIVKSTVPLIKDGIDGRDGESWQYIFTRSNYYPFEEAQKNDGILDPSEWKTQIYDDDKDEYVYVSSDFYRKDNTSEFLGPDGTTWVDDHQGVDKDHRYEYQSYRRWDANKKEWGIYYPPTLYSNYALDGVDGSGFLTSFSNPIAVIPVGESGYKCEESLDKNVVNQKDSTEVYFYNGSLNLSTYQNLEISIDETSDKKEHFRVERINDIWNIFFDPVVYNEDGSVKSVFDFGDKGERFTIGVISKYTMPFGAGEGDEYYEGLVRWTLSPIKGLEDFEVFVDHRVVNTTKDKTTTFRVGYYKISTNGGKHFVEKYSDADGMKIKIHNSVDPTELENVDYVNGDSWNECYYDFGNDERCYVILLDKDGNIVDYTSVESVSNGKDGYNGYHLELSQDYISLPWNENKTGVNSKYDDSELTGKPISSKMTLYTDNSKEVKSGITYEVIGLKEDTGYEVTFEVDEDGHRTGKFTIPKEMFDGDNNLTCRATYQEIIYEKVLFVDLEETPYELEFNKNILQRNGDDGKLLDESISVKVKYWMDGVWKNTSDGKVVLDCDNISEKISDNGTDESKKYIRTIFFTDELKNNNIDNQVKISYYETDENGNIIGEELSYEYIGILDNGKTGSSPYRLDLSNENVTLACDSEGNIYGTGYDKNGIDNDEDPSDDVITTKVTLFCGAEKIKLEPDDISVTYNNKDITSDVLSDTDGDGVIEYTLPATFLNSLNGANNSINFKALYKTVEVNATMSIGKIKSQYRYYLRPSVSSVTKYKDGSYSVSNVKCALWKQDGSKKPVEVTDSSIVSSIVKYKFTENGTTYNYNNGVAVKDSYNEIWFEAKEGEVLWDREIVPILKDGKDGSAPTCTAVETLGYSKIKGLPLYENFEGYENWKQSIRETESGAGDTVYILQEYTWESADGSISTYKTRGVTSTVAGVQGSNGRMLFYLGSFEQGKATIQGESIKGRLTKTVCDYYIDYSGKAWMRIGDQDSDGSDGEVGYRVGSQNNKSYWEESQKVGFIQAGAITADMINTGSLAADKGFITSLSTSELSVKASNVKQLEEALKDSDTIKSKASSADLKVEAEKISALQTDYETINGRITNINNAGFITEAGAAKVFADKITLDDKGNVKNIDKSGLLTEASAATLFASKQDMDGKVSKAEIIAAINESGESNAKISADRITLTGKTISAISDNFQLTNDGDLTITGDITAEKLTLVDGKNNSNFSAWFVFEDVEVEDLSETILCPVLYWVNANGKYKLDMSKVVMKLNEDNTKTTYFPSNIKLYKLNNNKCYVDEETNIFELWEVDENNNKLWLYDSKLYKGNSSKFTPISGTYYIRRDYIGVPTYPINNSTNFKCKLYGAPKYGYNNDYEELTTEVYDESQNPYCAIFIKMSVLEKINISSGNVPSKNMVSGEYILVHEGRINIDGSYTYECIPLDGSSYSSVKMDVKFVSEKNNIFVPSDYVIINNGNAEGGYFKDDYKTFHANWMRVVIDGYGDEINGEKRVEYNMGLDKYVNFDSKSVYNCVDICLSGSSIKHYSYSEIMGDSGFDSDNNTDDDYNWLKTYNDLY